MIKQHFTKELLFTGDLKVGSKGMDVKRVQEWLNLNRYIHFQWQHIVTIDMQYGLATEAAVKAWQKFADLPITGVVDDATYQSLTVPLKAAFTPIDNPSVPIQALAVRYATQHLQNIPREVTGQNDGPWVRSYMDGKEGQAYAWCVGFVQTIYDMACSDHDKKYTDLMPATYSCDILGEFGLRNGILVRNEMMRNKDVAGFAKPGDVFLIRNPQNDRDWTHTGIIVSATGSLLETIEGNTNDEGSREGYEVCRRYRNVQKSIIEILRI